MNVAPADIATLSTILMSDAGISLERGKEYLIESRLSPIAQKEGLPSIDQLIRRIATTPGALRRRVVDAMTTNETSFFRDQLPFTLTKSTILPDLIRARAPLRRLRVWSAACSTGQEAVSLAITIADGFPELLTWNVKVTGSDVNSQVVERARAGRYQDHEINRGMPAPVLVRHFKRAGLEWEVSGTIRAMCEFKVGSLLENAGGPYDLVFLRNVLIYFSPETRTQVFRRVRAAMAPDGYLVLGAAEAAATIPEGFSRIVIGGMHVLRPSNP